MCDSNKPRAEWRRVFLRLPWLIIIPAGLMIPRLCAGHAAWIERVYSTGLYRYIQRGLSFFSSLVPFSLSELLLYAVVLTVLICLVTDALRVICGRAHFTALLRRLVSVAITFGALLILFYATWGLNYFRVPLKQRMELQITERSVDELEELALLLAGKANALRGEVPEDENGVATLADGYRAVFDALPETYRALGESEPALSGHVTRAKSVLLSKALSWCGITGIYVGLCAEPNVNVDAPAFLLPHTAAHELAHQLGVASEDEAEFAGYLACLESEDPAVRYSGVLAMLIDCGNALHAQSPERYEALYAGYGEGIKRDLVYQRAYWQGFEGKVEEKATEINDSYLKHNNQESGVKSYGEVVDMLLAYYGQTDF